MGAGFKEGLGRERGRGLGSAGRRFPELGGVCYRETRVKIASCEAKTALSAANASLLAIMNPPVTLPYHPNPTRHKPRPRSGPVQVLATATRAPPPNPGAHHPVLASFPQPPHQPPLFHKTRRGLTLVSARQPLGPT